MACIEKALPKKMQQELQKSIGKPLVVDAICFGLVIAAGGCELVYYVHFVDRGLGLDGDGASRCVSVLY